MDQVNFCLLIQAMNQDFLNRSPGNSEIEGVIQSYELAFRMQSAVPDTLDLAEETPQTHEMYGLNAEDVYNEALQNLAMKKPGWSSELVESNRRTM